MPDDGQENIEKEKVRLFEDNDVFNERLEQLHEVAPEHAAYSHNCVSAAFNRAISKRPVNAPFVFPDTTSPPAPSSRTQARIIDYFRWVRKFPDLPMEVILEVGSHLAPLTLLYFSRTSKLFRKTLMNKASRGVWRGALCTVLGLPPCPDDLNEALYTALVFDHHCFGCGLPEAFFVDYALRLRLCEGCWKANVINGSEFPGVVPQGVYSFVLMLLPSANTFNFSLFEDIKRSLTRVNPQTHLKQDSYFKPELKALLDFFWPKRLTAGDLTTLRTAFLDRAEQVVRRQMHAVGLYAWERVVGAEGHVVPNITLERATEDRYYIDLGFSMGWHMNSNWDEVPDGHDPNYVLAPTAEAIAEGVALNANPPKSTAQILKEHRLRACREHTAYTMRLAARYHQLAEWYEHLVADEENEDELPNAYDGARLFDALAMQNDARAAIHQDSVGALEPFASARARTYTYNVRCALAALLPPLPGPHKDTRGFLRDTLARPIALFACAFPGCLWEDHGFQWPDINWHWRDAHAEESVWIPAPKDRHIRATVWAEGMEVANRILDAAGLPRDTSMRLLTKLCKKRRLGCACGDPDLPESWCGLVRHVHDHLKMDKCRRARNGIPWINDHDDLNSCIKVFPKGVKTKAAFACVVAGQATTARIHALRAIQQGDTWLACLLCAAMVDRKNRANSGIGSSSQPSADAIVYHMQAKHGIPFDEKNVSFQLYSEPPPPEKVQVDLRKFYQS